MICESCGYRFLLESSTACPDCGNLREAIVKESDIQAAMDSAALVAVDKPGLSYGCASVDDMRVTPATPPFTMPVTGGSNWGPYCRAVSEAITDKMMKENPFLRALHTVSPAEGTDKPERRPDGTLKPAAKAWEAPRQGSDPRRIGS